MVKREFFIGRMWEVKSMKRFLKINFGVLIMAVGLYAFLIPENLAAGGVTGLAMVINNFFPVVPIGLVMIIANIVLFILAFLVIGKDFGGYTIYSSLLLSGMIYENASTGGHRYYRKNHYEVLQYGNR